MITRITGQLLRLEEEAAVLAVPPFEYLVFIASHTRRQLQTQMGEVVSFCTIHYFDGDPSRGRVTPRLVGFLNEVEREFFEMFCSVDGVGPKKALRAMGRPVKDIAVMIEEQDAKGLSALPGIGAATAERIIAKLRRKMSKFALLVAKDEVHEAIVQQDVVEETHQVLKQLGHADAEARRMLEAVLKLKKKYADVEALLQAVYQNKSGSSE